MFDDCMIYVDSADVGEVIEILLGKIGGEVREFGALVTPGLRVDAAHNDYEGADASGFLGYSSVLECEPVAGTPLESVINEVGRILRVLWEAGYRAVAACEYEDQLPDGGGIGRY